MLLLNSVRSVNLRELGSTAFAAKVFEALPGIISVFSLTCALAMQMRCGSASAVLDASGLWVCFVHLSSVSFLPSLRLFNPLQEPCLFISHRFGLHHVRLLHVLRGRPGKCYQQLSVQQLSVQQLLENG